MTLDKNKYLLTYAPILLVFVLGSYFYLYNFLEHYVLIEARCWINGGANRDGLYEILQIVWGHFKSFFEMPAFTRYFSIGFVEVTGALCKYDAACNNFPQIALILATGVLAFFLMRQLEVSPVLSVLPVMLWYFSLPVLDAIHWQATSHDKTAVFLMLASINLTLYFFKRKDSSSNIIVSNILIGLLVVFTYNTKEAAWAIGPSLFLLSYFTSKIYLENKFISNLKKIAFPLVYGFVFSVRHIYRLITDSADTHVLGASPLENIKIYLSYFVNSRSTDMQIHHVMLYVTILMMFIVVVSYIFLVKKENFKYKNNAYMLIWIFLTFLMSMIVALQTHYKSAFYMVVPSVFVYMFFILLLSLVWSVVIKPLDDDGKIKSKKIISSINVVLSFIVLYTLLSYLNDFKYHFNSYDKYFLSPSKNLNKDLPIIRRLIHEPEDSKIYISYPKSNHVGFMFLGEESCTYSFLFNENDKVRKKDKSLVYFNRSQLDGLRSSEVESYFILFTHDLKLNNIYRGKEELYSLK